MVVVGECYKGVGLSHRSIREMGRKKSSKAKGGGGGGGAAATAGEDQAVQREDESQEQVQVEAEKQVEEGAREEKVAEPVNATSMPEVRFQFTTVFCLEFAQDNNVHPGEEQDKVKAGDDSAHKYLSSSCCVQPSTSYRMSQVLP